MTRLLSVLVLSFLAMFPVRAQTIMWGDPMLDLPLCDKGTEWLRSHNFTSCYRVIIREESCSVPDETHKDAEMTCVIIPRPA